MGQIIYFEIFIYSTCVEETKYPLCSGTSFCANKQDLKWCKSKPAADWVPLYNSDYFNCNVLGKSNEKSLKGQQIKKVTKGDGRLFNCLNRQDEDPFKKTETKKWQGNQPCDDNGEEKRRCLGQRSEKCIRASSKFLITKLITLNTYTMNPQLCPMERNLGKTPRWVYWGLWAH